MIPQAFRPNSDPCLALCPKVVMSTVDWKHVAKVFDDEVDGEERGEMTPESSSEEGAVGKVVMTS